MCCLWNLDDLFEPLPLWFLYWSLFSLWISPDACLLPHISLPDSTPTGTLVWGANKAETQTEEARSKGLNRAPHGSSEHHWRKWHTTDTWIQKPQACGARLSESEQMVAWIVQQVPLQPHPCLACTTLPHQTPLIIDVLEWPHHHRILQSGRNIEVIPAVLKHLIYSEEGSATS